MYLIVSDQFRDQTVTVTWNGTTVTPNSTSSTTGTLFEGLDMPTKIGMKLECNGCRKTLFHKLHAITVITVNFLF